MVKGELEFCSNDIHLADKMFALSHSLLENTTKILSMFDRWLPDSSEIGDLLRDNVCRALKKS